MVRALLIAAWVAGALGADSGIYREWSTPENGARIRLAPCANDATRACGTIVWLKQAQDANGHPMRDIANPDPDLRGRALVGLLLVRDFRQSGPGRWTGGKIYDPNSGRTYASKLSVNVDGTLKVEGCVTIICQAQTWRPAN